jgi:hypothetical protein
VRLAVELISDSRSRRNTLCIEEDNKKFLTRYVLNNPVAQERAKSIQTILNDCLLLVKCSNTLFGASIALPKWSRDRMSRISDIS